LGAQRKINKPLTAAQMIDHSLAGRNFGEQIISKRKPKKNANHFHSGKGVFHNNC
jgi:hypothetical protein